MATEILLTALPYSVDPASPFHVSVHVSPRLSPSGTLTDFPVFEHWTQQLAAATLVVTDHTNEPFTITLTPPDDPTRWELVFPSTTPVAGFVPQSFEDTPWYSYPTTTMELFAKVIHLASMAASPVDPPLPSESPLTPLITRLADQIWRDREHGRNERGRLDETRLTRYLDDTMHSVEPPSDPGLNLLTQLHRVRRFYERPESVQAQYLTTPIPGAPTPRPRPMEPDFHQRVAMLGDHPNLLRELGLVVDVTVAEFDRLAAARWLTAHVVLDDGTDPTLPTRVSCQLDGDVFGTVARTTDWHGGLLRLGDESRYRVLDLDPDAAGLKLERFVVSLPRMADVEFNADPVTAAPPTLRATGFDIVADERLDRLTTHLDEHQARANALGTAAAPLLDTEDLMKGHRLEVWDDTTAAWYSLHLRSNDLDLAGTDTFHVDHEAGFIQGATASKTPEEAVAPGTTPKTYLHESLFGWSGWSLSAPHPAMRPEFVYEPDDTDGSHPTRREHVGDAEPPDDPQTNVVSHPRVAPGTLPRLRFGRSYAFRAWGVDIAGNSVPHDDIVDPAAPGSGPTVISSLTAPDERARGAASATRRTNRLDAPSEQATFLATELRAEARRLDVISSAQAPAVDADTVGVIADRALAAARAHGATSELQPMLKAMIAARIAAATPAAPAGRSARVAASARRVFDGEWPLHAARAWDAEDLARVIARGPRLALTSDTVTELRPLLRWAPVEPPAVVPRVAFGEGESVRHVVIRSGVDVVNDPETGDTITVVDPVTYAAAVAATHPEIVYRATCERHLAPPKTSQPDAEVHGCFDEAIGSSDPDDHQAMLLVALREAGTFFDRSIPSLTDPGDPIEVDYLRLEHGPGADPLLLVDLDDLDAEPGRALAPGQYLVADTEQLVLPYLPDPLANGISLRFPDAGLDRPGLTFPWGTEGLVTLLDGEWPAHEPVRIVLRGGATASGSVTGNTIGLALPPGDTLRARLSCSLREDDLDLLGAWMLLPTAQRGDRDMIDAARDGWLWALTPSDEIRFIHAVPRPLEAPRPVRLQAIRLEGWTSTVLFGSVDLHGPSTSRLDAEATWEEWIDDPVQPAPERRRSAATAFTTDIGPNEDMVILFGTDQTLPNPGQPEPIRLHASTHHLGDTKHRLIEYRFRATTRFSEYFHPSLLANASDRSTVGPVRRLSIPSSARPPKPVVRDVVPLFRWHTDVEPEQPFGMRRTRRAGLRIWLERSWYLTGDDERLAVVCAPSTDDKGLDTRVSQWGADPI
ncbi:MAG: hypothetical protein WKF45_02105, partial [Ilumatobacteraceae bacterium]